MTTTIRPGISVKKRYWISKERYYELKHFCLQYNEWKKLYLELSEADYPGSIVHESYGTEFTDKTAEKASTLYDLSRKMKLVEDAARKTDQSIGSYIFKAVTENRSYVYLSSMLDIPCGKDMFYDRYRKFFWLLSKERD